MYKYRIFTPQLIQELKLKTNLKALFSYPWKHEKTFKLIISVDDFYSFFFYSFSFFALRRNGLTTLSFTLVKHFLVTFFILIQKQPSQDPLPKIGTLSICQSTSEWLVSKIWLIGIPNVMDVIKT